MYICQYCGFSSENLNDFEYDQYGFECPDCINYTFYKDVPEEKRHKFFLILEDATIPSSTAVNPGFPTRVSPLRYPGGKSQLVGQIYAKTRNKNRINFVEPFAGGASVGLSLLLSGNIQELFLNDLDFGIYALFRTIKENPEYLLQQISAFVPTKAAYYKAQKTLFDDFRGISIEEAGWNTLIVNRLAFSGICKANCMGNPSARWNASALMKKIKNISLLSSHIHVSNMDACSFIEEMYWMPNATIFIDPPYVKKGASLYYKYYTEKEHLLLSHLLDSLYQGMPGADMIVTYDYCKYIEDLYETPVKEIIGRKYSIAN